MSRLLALKALFHDAVDATTALVREGNGSVGRSIGRVGSILPGEAREVVHFANGVRGVVTERVLRSVSGVNRLVAVLSDAALKHVPWPEGPPPQLPMDEEALVSPAGAVDQLIGLLNAAVGDHLRRSDNGLDLGMTLREIASPGLSPERRRTLVVAVHGLGTTELCWVFGATEGLGDPRTTVATRLADAVGGVPVYVRYNGGVSIADNGRALARALQDHVSASPVPVERIVMVGHSMGGLVARAAAHHALEAGMGWRTRLTHVATIGTPHLGAPLAAVGHTAAAVLGAVDLPATRILHLILDGRSEGIQDLRHGDPQVLGPLDPDVAWVFVAGSYLKDAHGRIGRAVGDLMVTVRSAEGPRPGDHVQVHTHRVGGVVHATVQTDARVVQAVVDGITVYG